MAFVYHYHATKQSGAGAVLNIDGLLLTEKPIDSMERYREVKDLIVQDQVLGFSDGLVINSLSLLHEVSEKPEGWEACAR